MKIIITGSLGNISHPLTKQLLAGGHEVVVVTSNNKKKSVIESLGANAAIGSVEDVNFLSDTFSGSDAVYTMIPPNNYFDPQLDLGAYYERLGKNYRQAVKNSGIKRLVHLSSIGAHLQTGNGILSGTYVVEQILKELDGVDLMFIRPTSFYYNLLGYLHDIRTNNFIAANYGNGSIVPWVSPFDIAEVVAEELVSSRQSGVRYVASEELDGEATAAILGKSIGQPGLVWKQISTRESVEKLIATGMNPGVAAGLAEMYEALQKGLLSEDYFRNRPAKMGKVKLSDYAVEFAAAYRAMQ